MLDQQYLKIAWRVGLICGWLFVTTACQPPVLPAVTYADLCGLTRDQFGRMDEQGVVQWIQGKKAQLFQATVPDLPADLKAYQLQALGWFQPPDTQTINVAYLRNGQIVRVSTQDIQNGPTFGQVVAGLGIPTTVYRSMLEYEQVLYTIGLEYPELGIIVYASGIENRHSLMRDNQLAVQLMPTLRVTRIECYEPSPIPEALHQFFFLSNESVALEMQRRIAWPGFEAWMPF